MNIKLMKTSNWDASKKLDFGYLFTIGKGINGRNVGPWEKDLGYKYNTVRHSRGNLIITTDFKNNFFLYSYIRYQ